MSDFKKLPAEIREKLREPFPQEALRRVPGAANLTSIKGMYVIERLNDVFGVCNWHLEWEEHQLSSESEIIVMGEIHIPEYGLTTPKTFGSSKQSYFKGTDTPVSDLGDLGKGAVSALISKCASFLEIGIDVFKGLKTHNTTQQPNPQPKTEPKKPEPKKKYPTIPDAQFSIEGIKKVGWDESLDNGLIILKDKKGKDVIYELNESQIMIVNQYFDEEHLKKITEKNIKKEITNLKKQEDYRNYTDGQ